MSPPLIKVTNLKVIYNLGKSNEVQAIKGVDFEIYPEEFIIFFGPSGCGKSTILHCIAGLEIPTSGSVWVANRNLAELNNHEMSAYHRRQIGIIFQAYNLISTINVLENVALPQILDSRPFGERYSRAYELLARFGIKQEAKRLPPQLSGGQQQRVDIARALINNPLILLADEPVGNLDSNSAQVVLQILQDLNTKEKKTIILVTHDPSYLTLPNRIFYIKDGLIVKVEENQNKRAIAPKDAEPRVETIQKQLSGASHETQAKLLTARFLERYNEEEKSRFEQSIEQFLADALSKEDLEDILDRPFENGGVGFYSQTANKIASELGDIKEELRKFRAIEVEEEHAKEKTEEDKMLIKEKATRVREHLLDIYQGQLSDDEIQRLDELLYNYLLGDLSFEELERVWKAPKRKTGFNIRRRTRERWRQEMAIWVK